MKHFWLACFLLVGCGSTLQALSPEPQQIVVQPLPLKVSILPPSLDIEKLLPKEPDAVSAGKRFDDISIDENKVLCAAPKEKPSACQNIPAGILVDEFTYAQKLIADQARLKRISLELNIFKELIDQERTQVRAAEMLYQQKIVDTTNALTEAQKPRRWESWRFYAGFFIGAGLTVAAGWAMHEVAH